MSRSAAPRVLCVRRGALGDTLLMVPVLRALRRAHPDAGLVFAGVEEHAALLAVAGVVDRALSGELLHDACTGRGPLPPALAPLQRVVADDPRWTALTGPHTAVQCFDPRPHTLEPLPVQLAGQLGLPLCWPEDGWLAPARGAGGAGGAIVLAPGSGGAAKCWPRRHWLALARELALRGAPIDVLVGPVELERDDPRAWPWPVPVGFVLAPPPGALLARLQAARAFAGNDSGPTHLAAMLAVPTVALFGPSEAAVFAPNGPFTEVVEAPGRELERLEPARVIAALVRVGAAAAQGSRARTRCQ